MSHNPPSAQSEAAIAALERLSGAAAEPRAGQRAEAALLSGEALIALPHGPPWLPRGDYAYYVGRAALLAGDPESAAEALGMVPDDSICAPEAHWLLAKVALTRVVANDAVAEQLRPGACAEYGRIAALRPLSPLVQLVADWQTEQRERAVGVYGTRPRARAPKVGLRYDPRTLERVASLYERQGLLAEAAQAYLWAVDVRYPDDWLGEVSAGAWRRVADVHARLGDRTGACRYLAKCYALPLREEDARHVSSILRELLRSSAPRDVRGDQAPAPRPEAATLVEIGDLLASAEMWDEAAAAYGRAEVAGAGGGARAKAAEALAARADFLLAYRTARTEHAVLYGRPIAELGPRPPPVAPRW